MPVTRMGWQADIGIIRSPEQVIDVSIVGVQVQTAIRYLLRLASDFRQVTLADDMHTLPDAHFIERVGQCPSIVNSSNAQIASCSLLRIHNTQQLALLMQNEKAAFTRLRGHDILTRIEESSKHAPGVRV